VQDETSGWQGGAVWPAVGSIGREREQGRSPGVDCSWVRLTAGCVQTSSVDRHLGGMVVVVGRAGGRRRFGFCVIVSQARLF
jgi:hypothetical protein